MRTVAICLMLLQSGCAATSAAVAEPTQPGQTAGTPTAPAADPQGAVLIESVRAYLQAFRLDEKTLPAGLTISWALGVPPRGSWPTFGFARATGKLGPGGHQVYEVTSFDGVSPGGGGGLSTQRHFIEIAPDTSAVPQTTRN